MPKFHGSTIVDPTGFPKQGSGFPPGAEDLDPAYDGRHHTFLTRSLRTAEAVCGLTRYAPGGFCGPRVQRDFQLVLLHSGSASVLVDGQRRTLAPSDLHLFRPGHRELFRFSEREETAHSWLTLSASAFPGALKKTLEHCPETAACSDAFRALLEAAFALGSVEGETARSVVSHLALAMFSEYLRCVEQQAVGHRAAPVVERAVTWIEAHFAEPDCSVRALKAAGCSRNTLLTQFKKSLGTTPSRHLWALRLEKGHTLLTQTGLPLAEIAAQCGFKNAFHFSRCITRSQGRSPRALRRARWKAGGARD